MTTENKPREFWIWGFKIGPDESISQNCSVHLGKGGSEWYDPVHHVIEYAAVEQLKADLKKITDENYEIRCQRQSWMNKIDEANYTENSALLQLKEMKIEIQQLKSKIEYANDEIHTLKNKLLVFEGMTFSENQEITALKSKLEVAKKAMQREIKWRTVKYCTEDGLDNLGQALKEISEG